MSLIAYMPFDTDAKDTLGYLNTPVVNATLSPNGRFGSCYYFPSNTSYIMYQNVKFGNTVSVSFWSRKNSGTNGSNCMPFSFNSDSINSGPDLYYTGSLLYWNIGDGASSPFKFVDSTVIPPAEETWNHFVVVNDNAKQKTFLYINGVLAGTATYRLTNTTFSDRNFVIGNYFTGANFSYGYLGYIDDFRIYDHALSASEVYSLYSTSESSLIHNLHLDSGLIAHYRLDDEVESYTNVHPYNSANFGSGYQHTYIGSNTWRYTYVAGQTWTYHGNQLTIVSGKPYTFSMEVWMSPDCNNTTGFVADLERGLSRYFNYDLGKKGTWQKFVHTQVSTGTDLLVLRYPNTDTSFSAGTLLYRNMMLSQTDHEVPFNTGTFTGKLSDSSQYRNNTITPTVPSPKFIATDPFKRKGYYYFDGTGYFTSTNYMVNRTNGQELTVSCWIKCERLGGQYQTIVANRSSSATFNWMLYQHAIDGSLQLHGNAQNKSTYIPPLNEWLYVVSSVDKNGKYSLYVNKELKFVTEGFQYGTAANSLNIGGYPSFQEMFKGSIADVRVYDRVTSLEEMTRIMDSRVCIDNKNNISGTFLKESLTAIPYKPTIIDYRTWLPNGYQVPPSHGSGCNGDNNYVIVKENPVGVLDEVWAAMNNDAASDDDGGWNYAEFPIDKTKKYRYSVWIRRDISSAGNMYFGPAPFGSSQVRELTGSTPNTNPYMYARAWGAMPINTWLLFVGYVWPYTHTGTTAFGRVYYQNGTEYGGPENDFKWESTATYGCHRAYQFYTTDPNTHQFFYRPRVDLCDGTEPSIATLLSCAENPILYNNRNYIKVHGWNFNDVYGTTVKDNVLNKNATLVNSPSFEKGVFSQAVRLNGTNQYITAYAGGVTSLSLWFKHDVSASSSLATIISGVNFAVYLGDSTGGYTDESLYFYSTSNRGSFNLAIRKGNAYYKDGKWHHLVINFGGTNGLYLDGVKQEFTIAAGSLNLDARQYMGTIDIGRTPSNTGFFTGCLEDIGLYRYELTQDEILNLYNNRPLDYSMDTKIAIKNTGVIETNTFSEIKKQDGILAHYLFDGRRVLDASGNNYNTSTYNTSLILNRKGDGLSSYFNGTNSYVSTYIPQEALVNRFSISAWIYAESGSNYRGVLGDHGGATQGLAFCQFENGFLTNLIGNGSAWTAKVKTTISLNTWYHVVFVYQGGANGFNSLYVNGVRADHVPHTSTMVPLWGNPIIIGRAYNSTDRYWLGKIEDMRIFTKTLSPTEINALYTDTNIKAKSISLSANLDIQANQIMEII